MYGKHSFVASAEILSNIRMLHYRPLRHAESQVGKEQDPTKETERKWTP
jgi:hypothetical protein